MNGAESMLQTLINNVVEVCFTNPGTSEMHMVSAIGASQEMRSILCLFEGGCSGAADGYARMAGKPACTLFHLGPGFANALANNHNARRGASPVINLIGFIALALRPSLLMLIPFQVTRRAIHYAIARPARELLFTKVDGITRYQSKNLIDSFVYRSGDALGAAAFGRLTALTLSLSAIAALAVPIAAFWAILGWWLGGREPEPEIAERDATMRSDEL